MLDSGRPSHTAPETLQHYLDAGFEPSRMHVIVNVHPGRAMYFAREIDLLEDIQIPYCFFDRHFTNDAKRAYADAAMLSLGCRMHDWVVHVDIDEHHEYPTGNIRQFLIAVDQARLAVVTGKFADRISYDDRFRPITAEENLAETYPYACNITRGIRNSNPSKLMAYKAFLVPGSGGFHGLNPYHQCNNNRRGISGIRVHHFKYVDDVMEEMHYRAVTYRAHGVTQAKELQCKYDQFARWGNCVCVECPEPAASSWRSYPRLNVLVRKRYPCMPRQNQPSTDINYRLYQ